MLAPASLKYLLRTRHAERTRKKSQSFRRKPPPVQKNGAGD
ncbi:hypothetical protein [Sorangium sp. So ce341]